MLVAACGGTIDFSATPTRITELDKLVVDINGYGSPTDYAHHADTYVDDAVVWPGIDCSGKLVSEDATRRTTRTKDGKLAKLELTWTAATIATRTTTHESYHYENGHLRVVVIDQETDHSIDQAYMALVDDANETIMQRLSSMPRTTPSEQAAAINQERQLRDGQIIVQDWLYFDENGTLIYELRKRGIERARAVDYPNIPQRFPTLYSDVHPAHVIGSPYLVALDDYAYQPLVVQEVDSTTTMLGSLVASDPFDGEMSLKTKPACR